MNEDTAIAVVLHFRTVDATAECLASLRRSGVRRTVLVDNSEDEGRSLARLSSHLDDLLAGGMATSVVSPGINLGFARGVNTGIAHALAAGADKILLINSDARLAPGSLSAMCSQMKIEGAGAIAPSIVMGTGFPAEALHYQVLTAVVTPVAKPGSIEILSGACLLVGREVAISFPFDESFFFYGEDVDWSHRLAKANVVTRHSSAIVLHAGAGSSQDGSFFYEYHTVRGHWLLAMRLLDSPLVQSSALVLRVGTLGARAALRSLRSSSLVPVRALFRATLDVVRRRRVTLTPPAEVVSRDEDAQR
ncbi:MAG: glycosyltransferase family 2 protein [Luteimonas sp.]